MGQSFSTIAGKCCCHNNKWCGSPSQDIEITTKGIWMQDCPKLSGCYCNKIFPTMLRKVNKQFYV